MLFTLTNQMKFMEMIFFNSKNIIFGFELWIIKYENINTKIIYFFLIDNQIYNSKFKTLSSTKTLIWNLIYSIWNLIQALFQSFIKNHFFFMKKNFFEKQTTTYDYIYQTWHQINFSFQGSLFWRHFLPSSNFIFFLF